MALVTSNWLKLAGLYVKHSGTSVDIKIYLTIDCEQGTGNKECVQVGENIPVQIMVGMAIMINDHHGSFEVNDGDENTKDCDGTDDYDAGS